MKQIYLFTLLVLYCIYLHPQSPEYPYISEILYDSPLTTHDNKPSQNGKYIEIYNPSTIPCNLERYSLQTNNNIYQRFGFGDIVMEPQSYIIVMFRDAGNSSFYIRDFFKDFRPYSQVGWNLFYQNRLKLDDEGGVIHFFDDREEIIDCIAYGNQTKKLSSLPSEDVEDLIARNNKGEKGPFTTNQLLSLQRSTKITRDPSSGFIAFDTYEWKCASSTPYTQNQPVISEWNYIRIKQFTTSKGKEGIEEFHYFDGLGKKIQIVEKEKSPNKSDIGNWIEYDPLGRSSKSWIPIPTSGDKGAICFEIPEIATEYSNILNFDHNPYSKTIYESSPSNRILAEYGPGEDWHKGYGNDSRPNKFEYLTNYGRSGDLACRLFRIHNSGINTTLINDGYYDNNQLFIVRKTDEDLNISYEFQNKSQQTILLRKINNKEYYDTYYVYDDFGNLQYVLPPLVIDNISQGLSDNSNLLKQYAYLYKYDKRNRCIRKRVPGTDWVFNGYDSHDRLIISQDGEQRVNKECSYYHYDELNRLIETGECPNNDFSDAFLAILERHMKESGNIDELLGDQCTYFNYQYNYRPSYSSRKELDYDNSKEKEFGIRYGGDPNKPYQEKELLTYQSTSLILNGVNKYGGNKSIETMRYYDNEGRVIQQRSNNHLDGYDAIYTAYNFTGQPIKKIIIHTAKINNVIQKTEELYTYSYDHAGRLIAIQHKLNNGYENEILRNTYDRLGRLEYKYLGPSQEPNLITMHSYNIRSWLTDIKNLDADFAEELHYTPGGNIKKMRWITPDYDLPDRGYSLYYDNLSQLIRADYMENDDINDQQYFHVKYSYDKHGNITSLNRRNTTSMDDLTYRYIGNQLKSINDECGPSSDASLNDEFKDWAKKDVEYTFNQNGAMIQDLNKGITNIKYSAMNLPMVIDIKSPIAEARNEYLYSADNTKLQVVQHYNPNYSETPIIGTNINVSNLTQKKTTDYIGNKVYENGKLKKILVNDGYYNVEQNSYYFFLKDHLGNNRAVLDDNGARTIQFTHYYPFGLSFDESKAQGEQPYKYNGKEYDKMHGLNLYDYSARFYDPAIGRFTSIDPLAEKYYSWSPYAYVMNNPLKYIDPDGRQVGWPINTGQIQDAVNNQIGQKAQIAYGNSEEFRTKVITGILSVTDVNDATVIGTTITRGSGAINVDGTSATTLDIIAAGAGAIIPVVSGAAVKKLGGAIVDKIGSVVKKFDGGSSTTSETRREAFRKAKDQNGIPRSSQPNTTYTVPDKNTGKPLQQYEYTNSKGEKVVIRKDNPVTYPDGGQQGTHYNAGKPKEEAEKLKQHHNYED